MAVALLGAGRGGGPEDTGDPFRRVRGLNERLAGTLQNKILETHRMLSSQWYRSGSNQRSTGRSS